MKHIKIQPLFKKKKLIINSTLHALSIYIQVNIRKYMNNKINEKSYFS